MAQWRSSGVLNPNGISTTDIKQWLSLGREPSSSLHIINSDGTEDDSFFNTSGWCGRNVSVRELMNILKMDSSSYAVYIRLVKDKQNTQQYGIFWP